MKAPLSWLREYVPIEITVEELSSRLALTGTEVERVSEVGVPGDEENLERFVVGKVLDCRRHLDADKLSVCSVDVGEGEARTIVCGAPNVATGQTVAVVLPGGVMPDGTRIRDAKLRGVQSAGMILSEAELGLAAKSPGIMVLPDAWEAGELLIDHFALTDWVLEVEVTPNRPDCLSIRGLAREIAAITEVSFDEDIGFSHPWGDRPIDQDIAIEVHDPDLCPRYTARVIRGVTIAESPLWLKACICHAGMRPISNVVDVTNYVLWSLGQPLHAFDLCTVRGGRIIVRRAHPGETITTLDNEARVLTEDMLVIADADRASVVAGIMGGLDSEVTDSTTDILLEGANFAGPSIMRTSGALGLRSEASTRYEKGLDPGLIPLALDAACHLLVDICGGTVSVGTIDVRSPLSAEKVVKLRPGRVEHVLGAAVPAAQITAILARLGCNVSECGEDFLVTVPGFRADLEREIDLIEEVARVHGLDQIPSTLPARRAGKGGLDRSQAQRRHIEDLLAGAGLSQVITYSFGDDKWYDRLRLAPEDRRRMDVKIANPLSSDQAFMWTMLLPALLDAVRKNLAVREERVHIFEVGRVFRPSEGILPEEKTQVGILIAGEWDGDSWLRSGVTVDYYLIKGLIERLAAGLGCRLDYGPSDDRFLHPGKGAAVHDAGGRHVGWLGEVHPLVIQAYDLRAPVVAAELDLDALIDASVAVPMFRDLLGYPAVEQDLALVMDAQVPAAAVMEALRMAGGELLEDMWVFDVYEGAQVPPGKKSLALRLSFRASDRTLSDAEVNEVRAGMLRQVGASLGAELRA
ncbi:MAG: phenylalanine--tRNA ligase subunit beta [bacterium]